MKGVAQTRYSLLLVLLAAQGPFLLATLWLARAGASTWLASDVVAVAFASATTLAATMITYRLLRLEREREASFEEHLIELETTMKKLLAAESVAEKRLPAQVQHAVVESFEELMRRAQAGKGQSNVELKIDPSVPAEARTIIAEEFRRIFT